MTDTSRSDYARGLTMSALGMLILSPDAMLLRMITDAGLWDVIFYRMLFMGSSLALVLAVRHGRAVIRVFRAPGWPLLVSTCLLSASNLSFVGAITHTSVANTLIILATLPLFSAVLGWVLIKERVRARTWWAIAAALGGVGVIVSGSLGGGHWVGDALAANTALMQGLNLVLLRRVGQGVMMPALCLSGFAAAALALPLAAPATIGAHDLALLGLLGFVILPLSLALFLGGTRSVPAAEVALLALIETVLGPLWAWIGVGEVPAAASMVGGVIIIGAVTANAALALARPAVAQE